MQLSDLLGSRVETTSGAVLGRVTDVRLAVEGDLADRPRAPVVFGLLVSPRTGSSYLGYERSGVREPVLVAAVLRWRHRGTFLVAWRDVVDVGPERVRLADGFTRYSPVLRDQRTDRG
jgi:sporulation protein YlmC with PRC-barrel domain